MGPGCFVHGGVFVVVSWLWCCCLICLILCFARSNLGWSFGGWYSWMVGLVVSGCFGGIVVCDGGRSGEWFHGDRPSLFFVFVGVCWWSFVLGLCGVVFGLWCVGVLWWLDCC